MKIIFITLALISLSMGIIGIVVPGMPTTVFLLVSAGLLVKSNQRLYNWLINHKVLGKFIKDYREHRAMPKKSKIMALVMMTSMVSMSVIFFIDPIPIKIIVAIAGVIGFIAIIRVPTID
jgi:uncharacterized membrane protein YbaN (DUF454 family)